MLQVGHSGTFSAGEVLNLRDQLGGTEFEFSAFADGEDYEVLQGLWQTDGRSSLTDSHRAAPLSETETMTRLQTQWELSSLIR